MARIPHVIAGEKVTDAERTQPVYNPATGEGYIGFQQTCGHGTAAFLTPSGTYQLRDLTTEDRGVIAEFDAGLHDKADDAGKGIRQPGLVHQVFHHELGHRAAADIAVADE